MELGKDGSDVVKFSCSGNKSGDRILNELESVSVFFRYAKQERIAVVKFSIDDAAGNCAQDLRWETGAYMTHGAEMEVGCFTDRINVLTEAELRIKSDAKTLESRRDRYDSTGNVDCYGVIRVSGGSGSSEEDGFRFAGVEAKAIEEEPATDCWCTTSEVAGIVSIVVVQRDI